MKKRLAIFGVIAALLMLAACSAAAPEYGTEQTQEQEQIVLHLFHYQGEAEEAYGHVIAAYEKAHPNVKIKSEFLNSENYNSTLDARIAVQDCPDLIGVHPGYAQALPLARAGYLADLSGQPCLENVRESDAETGSLAGSIYAAPTDLTYICTFYNADIFAQYDLPVPTTWQEFLDVCRKLKDEGITPLSVCYKDAWIQSLIPYALSATTIYRENPDFDREMADGTRHFDGAEWKKTFEMLKTLIDSGYVTENFLQTTYDQQLRAFADGRAAMMVMGSWGVSMIRSMNAGCNFGLFILLTNDDVYRQFLQETGNLPVKTGFDAGCDPVLETLISGITDSYPFLDVNWPSGMQMVFLKTVEEISTGGSIDDALDRLDQTWTEIYKKEE